MFILYKSPRRLSQSSFVTLVFTFFTGIPIASSAIHDFPEFILPRYAPRQRNRHCHFCFAFTQLLRSSRGFRFVFFIFCFSLLVLFVSLIRLVVVLFS